MHINSAACMDVDNVHLLGNQFQMYYTAVIISGMAC